MFAFWRRGNDWGTRENLIFNTSRKLFALSGVPRSDDLSIASSLRLFCFSLKIITKHYWFYFFKVIENATIWVLRRCEKWRWKRWGIDRKWKSFSNRTRSTLLKDAFNERRVEHWQLYYENLRLYWKEAAPVSSLILLDLNCSMKIVIGSVEEEIVEVKAQRWENADRWKAPSVEHEILWDFCLKKDFKAPN